MQLICSSEKKLEFRNDSKLRNQREGDERLMRRGRTWNLRMAAVSACTRRVTHGWTSARVRRVRSKKEAAHTHPATADSAAACHLVRPAPAPVPKPTTAASMSNSKRRCLAPIGSAVRGTRTRSPHRREWRRLAGTPQRWRADSCSGEARRPRRTGSSGSRGELDLDGTATGGGAEDEEEVVALARFVVAGRPPLWTAALGLGRLSFFFVSW